MAHSISLHLFAVAVVVGIAVLNSGVTAQEGHDSLHIRVTVEYIPGTDISTDDKFSVWVAFSPNNDSAEEYLISAQNNAAYRWASFDLSYHTHTVVDRCRELAQISGQAGLWHVVIFDELGEVVYDSVCLPTPSEAQILRYYSVRFINHTPQ